MDEQSRPRNPVVLGPTPLYFDADFSRFNFDRCNREIVTTKERTVNRYFTRGIEPDTVTITLRFNVDSCLAKCSLTDHKYLGILKEPTQLELVDLQSSTKFSQPCKRQGSVIRDFFWCGPTTFFFVTNNGFELYELTPKKILRFLKEQKIPVKWHLYSSKLLFIASGPLNTQISSFFFTPNGCIKLPKFDLDSTEKVESRDVAIGRLYEKVYFIHHQKSKQQLHLYYMNREAVTRALVIPVGTEGPIAIHIVDNLLVVHSLQQNVSLLFDVKDKDEPLVGPPLPIAAPDNKTKEVYCSSWHYVQPFFIIDPDKGILWEVRINMLAITKTAKAEDKLVDFLLRRSNSKKLILETLCNVIERRSPLYLLSRIFKKLNSILQSNPGHEDKDWSKKSSSFPTESTASVTSRHFDKPEQDLQRSIKREGAVVITQADMHKHVFLHFDSMEVFDQKYFVSVLVEYIKSLTALNIEVLHFLYEMVINLLVHNHRFFQLHQFLQYHVIADSPAVACQLLALEKIYAPAGQLALDMLKRLNSPASNMVEILLLRNQVLAALRLVEKYREIKIEPTRFLEVVAASEDDTLFYTVYQFFKHRVDKQSFMDFEIVYDKRFGQLTNETTKTPV